VKNDKKRDIFFIYIINNRSPNFSSTWRIW